MGLAASQATLLQITARISDVELEAQQIQHAKLRLALQEDEVSQKYLDALDAQTLTIPGGPNGERIAATFDNICGLGSLNTQMGTANHYIFYDKDDQLIVPSEIYQGYQEYGGSDPYEFAMFMLGIDVNDTKYQGAVDEIGTALDNDIWTKVLEKYQGDIDKIYDASSCKQQNENNSDAKKDWLATDFKVVITSNSPLSDLLTKDCSEDTRKAIENLVKEIKNSYRNEYEYSLYKKNSGAQKIYEAASEAGIANTDAEFDKEKFNYYLRWGQLIEREGGVDTNSKGEITGLLGCTSANAYSCNIENNPDLLNQMILYGFISIDVVYDNGKEGISATRTSTSTDPIVTFQNTSTIDSTAVKKAEAEYNREMKKINKIDKNYDLSLNRLETERNALTKQYDSVKKVAEDNIERTFGIFS